MQNEANYKFIYCSVILKKKGGGERRESRIVNQVECYSYKMQ